jgi:2,4-dienoyl-CoA reductase-like NADH-dependent reductase (Old Yellow Enzyme family)
MKLQETTQLGNLALRNRMVMSATTRSRADSQGIRLYLTSWKVYSQANFHP